MTKEVKVKQREKFDLSVFTFEKKYVLEQKGNENNSFEIEELLGEVVLICV